ncbi:MAG: DUF2804 family protein [Nitriliruptorales bacterium]|nr:DUF2804 family protein [Nitriliruptorales bacterium]
MELLADAPPSPVDGRGGLTVGLYGGRMSGSPSRTLPRWRGRRRRWHYAAAGGEGIMVGAAVAHLGYAAAAFCWAVLDDELLTWEDRSLFGRGARVGLEPASSASWRRREAALVLRETGGIALDVPTDRGRLRARVSADSGLPVTLVTGTPGGGWNTTEKCAGYRATGSVAIGSHERRLQGGGWRDWTLGRQDAHTRWLWAAGAGRAGGREVGFNLSTGMNAAGPGENVVWWDGVPSPLDASAITPGGDRWALHGPGWELGFAPMAERAADERLGPFISSYVQPIGVFTGTLPGPDGAPVEVLLHGVTEDHEARW